MRDYPPPQQPSRLKSDDSLVVRFPAPVTDGRAANRKRPHWKDLLPRRWRRRVVIQGHRFVL